MKNNYFLVLVIFMLSGFLHLRATVVDVSHLIVNNNFEGDAAAWTVQFAGYGSVPQVNGVREAWANSNASHWFNCFQNIVVPAGVYRLTAHAFHRGYHTVITNAVLYGETTLQEYSVNVKPLSADVGAFGSTPNNTTTAKAGFNAGFWSNTVDNIVVPDEGDGMGTLRVGIRNVAPLIRATSATAGDIWTAWSNFRLFQLNGSSLLPASSMVIAQANDLLATAPIFDDGGVLSSAVATLQSIPIDNITVPDIQALQNAINIYRENRVNIATSTAPVNVTHLIANPGFELGHTSVAGTANGHYNRPKGWTLTYNTAAVNVNNNITVINNQVIPAGVAANVVINPTQGARSLVARFRWTTSESFTIQQTVPNLRAGKYTFSADLGKLSTAGIARLTVTVAGNTVMNQDAVFTTGPLFTNVSTTFDALQGDVMVISLHMAQQGQVEATVMLDNLQLLYRGADPFLGVSTPTLAFSPSVRERILNVRAGNITNDITLVASEHFSLSATTIPAAQAMTSAGVNITVTCNATSEINNGTLTLSSGAMQSVVALTLAETPITVSHAGLFFDQTNAPQVAITVNGDLLNEIQITTPTGIHLSQSNISPAEALAGKIINVNWDQATSVNDQNILFASGNKAATVNVFAAFNNLIASWDGDNAEGELSRLTDFGWTLNNSLGENVTAPFNTFNATSGIRLVPLTPTLVYTYQGKTWAGNRVAYLRQWAADASNTYNLSVALDAGQLYLFRAVGAWHNNETNPSFTYSIRTGRDATATVLGSQANTFTVCQAGADYKFEFTPTTSGIHYVTVSSSAPNDAIHAPMYLAIVPKLTVDTHPSSASAIRVYPTVTQGAVRIDAGENALLRVFDLSGRVVLSQTVRSKTETIQLPSAGMFFVELTHGNERKTVKVLKVK